MKIKEHYSEEFRWFLSSNDYVGIRPPKFISDPCMVQPACLAQASQIYKQMAICGYLSRVMETDPVFKAERSFIGLDVEMEIKEHHSVVMDVVDRLFVAIFTRIWQGAPILAPKDPFVDLSRGKAETRPAGFGQVWYGVFYTTSMSTGR